MKTTPIDDTHAPGSKSWVESAHTPGTDFPIQNLPLGVFRTSGSGSNRIGAAIGDQVLDLRACLDRSLLTGMPTRILGACGDETLNGLMACADIERRALRHRLSHLLRAEGSQVTARPHASEVLIPQREVRMVLPARIADYTDFYASIDHATNVGSMMRPDNPLLPNYKWVPIGYHGRASSIVVSGTPVRRPSGQIDPTAPNQTPHFEPTKLLDYELEMGILIAGANELGSPTPITEAGARIFGLCLLNDWSARDVQKWEYQPLGPFLSKSFATSISPWVVTAEALAPFRVAAFHRPEGDPQPLPHLKSAQDQALGAFDVALEVLLSTRSMRAHGHEPVRLSRSNLASLYWTPAQMIAHHTSNGCNLNPGDLLGTGTVSGKDKDSRGCLLELTMRGKERISLPGGETRAFLEDGDEVIFRASCEREGFARIGFGECRGAVTG
ncbi:MAG: fumarylacetoacetase [Vicinamibacteria bacterium]|nr:fumarylacetoacetase [Vicinamibacteria bacterium]